jgi:hypothetical protein
MNNRFFDPVFVSVGYAYVCGLLAYWSNFSITHWDNAATCIGPLHEMLSQRLNILANLTTYITAIYINSWGSHASFRCKTTTDANYTTHFETMERVEQSCPTS